MSMDIQNCADLVVRGDADRAAAAMTAAPQDRGALFVLYAFNLEVARAPWVTKEAMIAEMRLQWWADAIEEIYEGGEVRRHEVVTPLTDLIRDNDLPRTAFDAMIEARRWDIYKEPHADAAAFEAYIADTAGSLMLVSALALGADKAQTAGLAQYGYGAGLASLLLAIPALENQQRYPLVDGRMDAVADLAKDGLDRMISARKSMRIAKPARAALRTAWKAEGVLRQAMSEPDLVMDNGLGASEFRNKLRLMQLALTHRF